MPNIHDKTAYIQEEIAEWRKRLSKAFLAVVNNKRKAKNLPLFHKTIVIDMPEGPNANLFLLTLKVWCIRYHVTPEWILEQLLWLYKGRRKPDDNEHQINLGLPAPMLVGTVARNYIEEALKLQFPNGENRSSKSIPVPQGIKVDHLDFSLPDSVQEYIDAIAKERDVFEKQIKPKKWKRNFRVE